MHSPETPSSVSKHFIWYPACHTALAFHSTRSQPVSYAGIHAHMVFKFSTADYACSGEGKIALEELLMARTTAKQMPLHNGGNRQIGTFLFDVREYREDAVEDEQVRLMLTHAAADLVFCPYSCLGCPACGSAEAYVHFDFNLVVPCTEYAADCICCCRSSFVSTFR